MSVHRVVPLLLALTACGFAGPGARAGDRPNVIVVVTDDQGYGDLSCHGNPVLKTPNLDALHAGSVRLTDFHVDPTCSPTRAALMTGRYSTRTGVWHTIAGRSLLHPDEVTLPERFAAAGYATAIRGKWHLGDNTPCLPGQRGFGDVFVHGGGGVGQVPDYWGNDYFSDTYFRGGGRSPEPTGGYCTDVWFRDAEQFVRDHRDEPFFLYLATNAPHGPYLVPEEEVAPFKAAGIESPRAEFYGMIARIDREFGRFRRTLDELGLADDTIFVFLTDNGTAAGARNGGFNAGMRGAKGSEFDGGHRVPCFVRWPAGGVGGPEKGRDVDGLAAHVDLFDTLCALAGIEAGDSPRGSRDGVDLSERLRGEEPMPPPRTLFVHSQRIERPGQWRRCAVMTDRWRLVNGTKLYDIDADPGQGIDLAARHPDRVAEMRKSYEEWWTSLTPVFDERVNLLLPTGEIPATFTAHDWHEPNNRPVPWNQPSIRKEPRATGWWAVDVPEAGRYDFTLRTRPPETDAVPMDAVTVRVSCGDVAAEETVSPTDGDATVPLDLPAGPAELRAELIDAAGEVRGAYYVVVRRSDGP